MGIHLTHVVTSGMDSRPERRRDIGDAFARESVDLAIGTRREEVAVASEGASTWCMNRSEAGNQEFYKIEMK